MLYHDEELNREFDIPEYNDIDGNTLMYEFSEEIYNAMYEAILLIENDKLSQAPCIIINDNVLYVNKDFNMINNIKSTLTYFSLTEEYEKCNVLKKIKEKYENSESK